MGLFDRSDKGGLPPPPAPTRRGANPWKFSDTAEKHESASDDEAPRELKGIFDVLDEAIKESQHGGSESADSPAPSRPQDPVDKKGRKRSSGSALAWIIFGVFAVMTLIEFFDGGESIFSLVPLVVMVFVAQRWLREKKRREQQDPES